VLVLAIRMRAPRFQGRPCFGGLVRMTWSCRADGWQGKERNRQDGGGRSMGPGMHGSMLPHEAPFSQRTAAFLGNPVLDTWETGQ